jgi:hypothetical protein
MFSKQIIFYIVGVEWQVRQKPSPFKANWLPMADHSLARQAPTGAQPT